MICHAVLREVVGANLLGPLARAHLRAAARIDLLALFALLAVEEAGTEDRHSLRPVLQLRALVLANGDYARREVGDADGGLILLDVLSTVSARAEVDRK